MESKLFLPSLSLSLSLSKIAWSLIMCSKYEMHLVESLESLEMMMQTHTKKENKFSQTLDLKIT
jgi:hypothetical protein